MEVFLCKCAHVYNFETASSGSRCMLLPAVVLPCVN